MYMNNGNSLFNLTSKGQFYFTSGVSGHCQKNQKLHIAVGEGIIESTDAAPGPGSSLPASAPSYPTVFGNIPVAASTSTPTSSSSQLTSSFPLFIIGFVILFYLMWWQDVTFYHYTRKSTGLSISSVPMLSIWRENFVSNHTWCLYMKNLSMSMLNNSSCWFICWVYPFLSLEQGPTYIYYIIILSAMLYFMIGDLLNTVSILHLLRRTLTNVVQLQVTTIKFVCYKIVTVNYPHSFNISYSIKVMK